MSLGLSGNNVVLGVVQVESSFAGPRFVTMTAVTVKGHRVPVVLVRRVARLPEPGRLGTAPPGPTRPVTPVASGAAPQRRLRLFRGPRRTGSPGLPLGGYSVEVLSNRRIVMGAEMILQGICNNAAPTRTPSSPASAGLTHPAR